MVQTAREAALTVLERCRRNQAFSDSLLANVLKESGLDARDRALTTKISYGVLQNTTLLDFYIDSFCNGASKLEPKVRDILRLSLYQILFLDKVPDHAAVSQAVELCNKIGFSRASGLVNAVLRRIVRSKDALPEIPQENKIRYLSIKLSTPEELVSEFVSDFGFDFTEQLLEANNSIAPLTIQVNTLKTTREELIAALAREGISATIQEGLENCLSLSSTGDLTELETFKAGLFFVQDTAAAMAILAANPSPAEKVLDACSAPGGKSFACALQMENQGEIIACDIHENKLSRVSKGAAHLGINIITTQLADATAPFEGFAEAFDLVIADVPCSGLGVIRKKPDIRFKNVKELSSLPELQLRILNNVSAYVKTGGTLLYSTCTILKRENEEVISAFLNAHPEFSTETFSLPALVGNVENGMVTLYPHIHNTDGFFICKLRKRNEN